VFLFYVVIEMALRCELRRTPRMLAQIRPLTSVQPHVRFQVSLFIEGFGARFNRTHIVTVALMLFQMDLKSLGATV
jgi:hypothetical protein